MSKALPLVLGPVAAETARFTSMFDRFFDCLNVSSLNAGARHRKSFLHPYRSASDERLEVCNMSYYLFMFEHPFNSGLRQSF